MIGTPQSFVQAVLEDLIRATGPLDGVIIKLFKNNLTPTPSTPLSAFEEADFDGYADSSAVVWGPVYHTTGDSVQVLGDNKSFISTGSTTPNNIYGWYATNAAGTVLKCFERFDEPVPVVEADQGLTVIPTLALPSDLFI